MPEKKEKTLVEKLLWVQTELKAPKKRRNKFANFDYRNCEDILEAVKPLLKEVGETLLMTDDVVLIGDRYYVKAVAMFGMTKDTKAITVTAFAREPETKKGMDSAQITGCASSYARKRALEGLLAIDSERDVDGEKPNNNNKPKDNFMDIVDKAFEEFQTTHLVYLEANENVQLSKDKFIKAIHKEFGQLPTKVESIPLIIKKLILSDVIEDEFDAHIAKGKDADVHNGND